MKVTHSGIWPDGSQPARFVQDNVPDDEPRQMPSHDITIKVVDDTQETTYQNKFWI